MTKALFIEKIKNGSDIEFTIEGKGYTICTWTEKGISISEWDNIENVKNYPTPEDLVNDYLIGTSVIGEVTDKIVITDYTSNGNEYSEGS